ncbi:hypothetical protein CLAIMM_10929 [Cladophialophora immunda]|nr:hypothetical protein CLAIMM_10929 [Cladophialophora immunda]
MVRHVSSGRLVQDDGCRQGGKRVLQSSWIRPIGNHVPQSSALETLPEKKFLQPRHRKAESRSLRLRAPITSGGRTTGDGSVAFVFPSQGVNVEPAAKGWRPRRRSNA